MTERGAALIDVVASVAFCLIMGAIVVPVIGGTLERERTVVGTRYLAGHLQRARLDAIRRARSVAVRFDVVGERTRFQSFADGN